MRIFFLQYNKYFSSFEFIGRHFFDKNPMRISNLLLNFYFDKNNKPGPRKIARK